MSWVFKVNNLLVILVVSMFFFSSAHYYDTDLNYYFYIAQKVSSFSQTLYIDLFDHKPPVFHYFLSLLTYFSNSYIALISLIYVLYILTFMTLLTINKSSISCIVLVIFTFSITGLSKYGFLNGSIVIFDLFLKVFSYILYSQRRHYKAGLALSFVSIFVRFDPSMFIILWSSAAVKAISLSCF